MGATREGARVVGHAHAFARVSSRVAAMCIALAALNAPLFSFAAQPQQQPAAAPLQLPVPNAQIYKPQPSGCQRWKGREFLSQYTERRTSCIAQCQVSRTSDGDGNTVRWKITGEPCGK